MKKSASLFAFVVAALAVIVAAVIVGGNMLTSHSQATTICARIGTNHTVVVADNKMVPATTTAHRCDTLTITNRDVVTREIGFGDHDHHVAYDGVSERVLRQDQNLSVTLVQTGTFHFHDHFHDEVTGSFTVTP